MVGRHLSPTWMRGNDELELRSEEDAGGSEGVGVSQSKATHKSDPCSALAQVVVSTEQVEDGQVNASQVVLRQGFERGQVDGNGANTVEYPLEYVPRWWWWWRCCEE